MSTGLSPGCSSCESASCKYALKRSRRQPRAGEPVIPGGDLDVVLGSWLWLGPTPAVVAFLECDPADGRALALYF